MIDEKIKIDFEVKPILKWVGGKRELIPEIKKYYDCLKFDKYIEPFFGGGSVYLDIIKKFGDEKNKNSIINDINGDLIEMYRNIKTRPNEILKYCNSLELDYKKHGYYYIRDRFNGIIIDNQLFKYEGVERSSSLILLNRTCFNGLYRVNKSGKFNVPVGSYKNPKIIDENNLYYLFDKLPLVGNILNVEFDKIKEIKKNDLVYFDPPYHPISTTSSFTDYSGSFGEKEQLRLRDYFKELDEKGVYVILSNSSSEFIKEIYKDFKLDEVMCRRNINSKGDKRGKISELLIIGNSLFNSLKYNK
jgi:DNA adenine methylase